MEKKKALKFLCNSIGYRGADEDFRKPPSCPEIHRRLNWQWATESKPMRVAQDDQVLQNLLATSPNISHPMPDITYGYNDHAFDALTNELILHLSKAVRVCASDGFGKSWFPYWVVQWVSSYSGESIREAIRQARRDAAAAVRAMFALYEECGVEPAIQHTTVFRCVWNRNRSSKLK